MQTEFLASCEKAEDLGTADHNGQSGVGTGTEKLVWRAVLCNEITLMNILVSWDQASWNLGVINCNSVSQYRNCPGRLRDTSVRFFLYIYIYINKAHCSSLSYGPLVPL